MQTLVSSFLGPLTCYLLMPTLVEVVNSQSVLCISWCQFIGYSRKLSSFYLWPSYSGGNEDNGDLLQKIPCVYCYTQCAQPCSKPAKCLLQLYSQLNRKVWAGKKNLKCILVAMLFEGYGSRDDRHPLDHGLPPSPSHPLLSSLLPPVSFPLSLPLEKGLQGWRDWE